MKTRIFLIILFTITGYCNSFGEESPQGDNPTGNAVINLFSTPSLHPLACKWVDEYKRINPLVTVNLIQDTGFGEMRDNNNGIGFTDDKSWISRNSSAWSMVVGRDIIAAVISKNNPLKNVLVSKGITVQNLRDLAEGKADKGKNIYVTDDASVKAGLMDFLDLNNLNSGNYKTIAATQLAETLREDPNAIVFGKLTWMTDQETQLLPENIELLPIDKNGNGKLEYMENIYENLQAFYRGVWIGKYPNSLSGKIYCVSREKPEKEAEIAFLNWVLGNGQPFLSAYGYNELELNERQVQLARIEPEAFVPSNTVNSTSFLKRFLALIALVVITFFLIRYTYGKRSKKSLEPKSFDGVLNESSTTIPGGLYFDKTHTWAFMNEDGNVKIGIDDFLPHVTGSITGIIMKRNGDKVKKGDHLVTLIQKGKQLEIYSPVTGTIKEKNRSLSSDPSLINTSPYEDGWIYRIEPKNWPLEILFLSMAEKYKNELKKEFSRLKDFLASALRTDEPEYAKILQDGGELKDHILADLGPEVWDDFQTQFIDTAR